jgi:Cu/Ag efflux protein CusF
MKRTLIALAVLLAVPVFARAQKPVTQGEAVEVTATIEAIDHDSRRVTLKGKDGDTETIRCGPEVKRFDELKVGDTVTFRYYESIVYAIRKPGQPSSLTKTSGKVETVRGTGTRPGATLSQQETATVTVQAIDANAPSVTVLTEDGRRATFKVEDKKNIKDLKVGDTVEITYTEAVLITVK